MTGLHVEPTTPAQSLPATGSQPARAFGKAASHASLHPGPFRSARGPALAWMTHDYSRERSRGDIHPVTTAAPANAAGTASPNAALPRS